MYIAIIIAVILLIYLISKRNKFNALRIDIQQQTSEIGNQIEKRSTCLNDALNIAKISYSHEMEGIEGATAKDQLNQLMFLTQKYPDLKFTQNYSQILTEAFELDKDIVASRTLLNGNIREYNEAISAFPGLIVAAIFGYKKEKFIDEENAAENKKIKKEVVDFSKF